VNDEALVSNENLVSNETTERLVGELTARLEPVKRVPRLEWVLGGILLLWAAHFLALVGSSGLAPGFGVAMPGNLAFMGAMLGLTLSAIGGLWGALSLGVPGHDAGARLGAIGAGVGLTLALVTVLSGLAASPDHSLALRSADWACFSQSLSLAIVPGGALLYFMFKGWVARPLLASAVALAAAFSIGAVTVHAVCPLIDAGHILLGHVGAPLGMLALATLPLALAFRRMAR
jgi:hypothetical protein